MFKLIIILFLFQATNYHLYEEREHIGILSIYGDTLWLKFDDEATITFKIMTKVERSYTTMYYVHNNDVKGIISHIKAKENSMFIFDLIMYNKYHSYFKLKIK